MLFSRLNNSCQVTQISVVTFDVCQTGILAKYSIVFTYVADNFLSYVHTAINSTSSFCHFIQNVSLTTLGFGSEV